MTMTKMKEFGYSGNVVSVVHGDDQYHFLFGYVGGSVVLAFPDEQVKEKDFIADFESALKAWNEDKEFHPNDSFIQLWYSKYENGVYETALRLGYCTVQFEDDDSHIKELMKIIPKLKAYLRKESK